MTSPVFSQETAEPIIKLDTEPFETAGNTGPVAVNRVLAVVGDQVLTMNDYTERYGDTKLSLRRLKPLVNRLLLRRAAKSNEVTLKESRLNQMVQQQIDRVSSAPGGLSRLLRRRGMTKNDYRQQLRKRIEKQVLENRLLRQYFPGLQNPDTRPASVSVRARLMMVEDVATAWWVYGWLNDSPDEATWNQLFSTYSKRLSLMGNHGDLGWFRWGYFNREVEYRIYSLPLYAVSQPFKLRNGYALVYPTGYRFTPNTQPGQKSKRAYRRYRQRFYRDRLYDKLRQDFEVNYPSSVRADLEAL
ncbi:MAG: peptidylprolyl isomerase [bacterium]